MTTEAKVLIVVIIITAALSLFILVHGVPQVLKPNLRRVLNAALFAFSHQQRQRRTHQDGSTVDVHEMVEHATVDATMDGTVRADSFFVETGMSRWQAFVRRFCRIRIPGLVRTNVLGEDHAPNMPSTVEERGEAVAKVGSIFEGETLARPEELDHQDLEVCVDCE